MKIGTWLILLAMIANGLSFSNIAAFSEDTNTPKIQTGDKWIYQETDRITNTPTARITWVVTEALDKTYTVNVTSSNGSSIVDVYDYNLNEIQSGQFTDSPNDGAGVADKKPGVSWKRSFIWRDTDKGVGGKSQMEGRCPIKETVTVPAGTFDTLKCFTKLRTHPSNSGPVIWETTMTSWYSPQAIHWVKRMYEIRNRGHLATSKLQELTEYHLN